MTYRLEFHQEVPKDEVPIDVLKGVDTRTTLDVLSED